MACEAWHKHRLDDLLACGIAGLSHDEFERYTEARCEEYAVEARRRLGLPADYPWWPEW